MNFTQNSSTLLYFAIFRAWTVDLRDCGTMNSIRLSACVVSVSSVGDTIKMSRFRHLSKILETVSVSVSPSQNFCIGNSLDIMYVFYINLKTRYGNLLPNDTVAAPLIMVKGWKELN